MYRSFLNRSALGIFARGSFDKWSDSEVKLDGEECLIMKESDIMDIIEGTPITSKKAA
jgi:hypothetical protein